MEPSTIAAAGSGTGQAQCFVEILRHPLAKKLAPAQFRHCLRVVLRGRLLQQRQPALGVTLPALAREQQLT